MKESEWRIARDLLKVALERFCQRILNEVRETSEKADETFHQRYLEVYQLIRERDRAVAWAFDGISRSRAIDKLVAVFCLELITAEELERFTPETQEMVRALANVQKRRRG